MDGEGRGWLDLEREPPDAEASLEQQECPSAVVLLTAMVSHASNVRGHNEH